MHLEQPHCLKDIAAEAVVGLEKEAEWKKGFG